MKKSFVNSIVKIQNAVSNNKKDCLVPLTNKNLCFISILYNNRLILFYKLYKGIIYISFRKRSLKKEGFCFSQFQSSKKRKSFKNRSFWHHSGLQSSFVSTSKGLITIADAKKLKVGGSYLCFFF